MVFRSLCCCYSSQKLLFFCLYQQNKSSESKVKFRQASNHCKMVLEAAKLPYATKPKCPLLPRNLALKNFGKLLIVFSAKINLVCLHYVMVQRYCLLYLTKQNCFLKSFLRTLILMTQEFLRLFSFLELIWSCIIFLSLQRWLKRS